MVFLHMLQRCGMCWDSAKLGHVSKMSKSQEFNQQVCLARELQCFERLFCFIIAVWCCKCSSSSVSRPFWVCNLLLLNFFKHWESFSLCRPCCFDFQLWNQWAVQNSLDKDLWAGHTWPALPFQWYHENGSQQRDSLLLCAQEDVFLLQAWLWPTLSSICCVKKLLAQVCFKVFPMPWVEVFVFQPCSGWSVWYAWSCWGLKVNASGYNLSEHI